MTEGKKCIECLSVIPKQANVCRYCGLRLEGIECPDCKSINKHGANICKWCGKSFKKKQGVGLLRPMEIETTFLGSIFTRLNFMPQMVKFSKDKIIVRTPGFFGLTMNEEEIPWEKVAGFQHKNGILWDTIWIETRGQTAASIWGLRGRDAVSIKKLLQKLEK